MDIKRFLKLLKRYAWILILLPIVAAALTYSLSKNLPKEYRSEVQIATGLVDQSKQVASGAGVDYYKINQQFNNIMEKLRMRKIMSILSYNLIIHDLSNRKDAFRPYSSKIDSLSESDKSELLNIYKARLETKSPITPYDNQGKFKLFDILTSMGYDEASIVKKLNIYRPDNSDFINITYSSEKPLLAPYLVNTLASEFIRNYSNDVYTNQNNSLVLLDSMLRKKEMDMNSKNAALKDFKMKNGVLNLDDQATTVYGQISAYEERKAAAIRDIQSNLGALTAINAKLRGGDPYAGGSTAAADNTELLSLRNQLKVANDKYIDDNFKAVDKKKVDSLQRLISQQSFKNSDNNVVDPKLSKQALITQKSNLEISTEQIKNTISSIDRELSSLRAQYNKMVPFDANIQNYVRDADIATKDYMAAMDRKNQTRTEQNMGLKLEIAQIGLPGVVQSSKAIIYVAASAVVTFGFCFVLLVVLFLLDKSVFTEAQLNGLTGGPIIGSLNFIKAENKDPRTIWTDGGDNHDFNVYKDLLRSIRFELDKELTRTKTQIIGVTSLNAAEGKSFLCSSLVYAFAMTGKKVLLISAESQVANINQSQKLIPSEIFETAITKKEFHTEDLITVFNSQSTNTSLLETQSTENLHNGFEALKKEFDLIIIDINSLKELNKAKEWLHFTDRSIAIFEFGNTIKDVDKDGIDYIKNTTGFMGWVLNKVKETV